MEWRAEIVDQTRRKICQLGLLLIGPACLSPVFGQNDKPRQTLHPPEPDEFDVWFLRERKSPNSPPMELQKRGQEFSNCLQRLFDTAAKLREMVVQLPTSEVFSVQVYKQAELIERLAKHLKRLATG